jgi:DNA-binding transcriptional MerR regulator
MLPRRSHAQSREAKQLFRVLREAGFTNRELEALVDKKWKMRTIKTYTGGVGVKDTSEKDRLMVDLRRFTIDGYKPENLKDYIEDKTIVEYYGFTFKDVVSEAGKLRSLGMNLENVDALNTWLDTHKLSYQKIITVMNEINRLKEQGLTPEVFQTMISSMEIYGSLENVLTALTEYSGLADIHNKKQELTEEINKLEKEIIRNEKTRDIISTMSASMMQYNIIAKNMVEKYSFDLLSFEDLMQLLSKHGSPFGMIEAINKYGKIEEMEHKIIELKQIKKSLEEDIIKKTSELGTRSGQLLDAVKSWGAMDQRIYKSRLLNHLADMLDDPGKIEISIIEFYRMSQLLIRGLIDYSVVHCERLDDWHEKVQGELLILEKNIEQVLNAHALQIQLDAKRRNRKKE